MFKRKAYGLLIASLAAAMTLTACGAGQSSQTGAKPASGEQKSSSSGAKNAGETKTVKIGIIGARTGASATLGQYLDGATAAFNEANEKGAVSGYKFEVIVRDDEANPTKSKELIKDLLHKEKVSAIIGPTNTSNALAILPEIFSAKVALIDPVATGTKIGEEAQKLAKDGDNYFFRTTTPDYAQAEAVANYVKKKGFKSPAILHDETAYGKGGAKELTDALDKAGVKPSKDIGFPMSSADLTPQVMQAKEAGADAVLVWALGHDQAQVAKAKQKLGFAVPMVGSTAMQQTNFRELAGEAASGNLSIWPMNHVREKKQGGRVERITKAYEIYHKQFPTGYSIEDGGSAMFSYDAAMMVIDAVGKAGADPKAIRDAIESMPHKNLASKDEIQYTKDNHEVWQVKDIGMVVVDHSKLYEMNE